MRNNKSIAIGIGIFGVFAILIAWMAIRPENPEKPGGTADASYGTIILPEAITLFEADGANGTVAVEPGKEGANRLPAGQYRIRFWKAERKDDAGNTWALAGQYFGQDNPFEIKAGGETKLDLGEPIVATVSAQNAGSSYAFNQVIEGRNDEVIELTRNGSRPQPPKLHIKNNDGSYSETFSFQYG